MNNKRGAIIFCYLLILVLTVLTGGLLLRSANEAKLAMRQANSATAFWAAEAGVHKALADYKNNNCAGFVQQGTSTACSNCACGGATKAIAATLTGYGDYDVTLDSANTTVQATGSVPSRTASNKIQRKIQASIPATMFFTRAAFAQGSLVVSNNALVDSYNSANGVYGGANKSSHGDIGSNGTTAGIIDVKEDAIVNGDASTGVNGTVTIEDEASVTGSITHTNNITIANVTVPSSLTGLSSGGVQHIDNNNTMTLTSGSYKYDSFSMNNNTTLNITGNVALYLTNTTSAFTTGSNSKVVINAGSTLTLYADGKVVFGNNEIANHTQIPSSLIIYSTYTGANGVELKNNGTLNGAIYAPQTNVLLDNNDSFYGSAVGKTVTLSNNGAIHYDQALQNLTNPFSAGASGSSLTNWQEI